MWLVGKWISDARAWGTNPTESAQYEFNARNQLTLWGPAVFPPPPYYYYLIFALYFAKLCVLELN